MSEWFDLDEVLPGLRGQILHAVDAADEPRVRAALAAAGFDVHVLEGARIVDEATFFDELARALPLPGHFGDNWDAFNDSLYNLCGRVAVVWRDAGQTLAHDAQTLLSAVQALADAGFEPARDPGEEMLQLEVFLLGPAPGFAALNH